LTNHRLFPYVVLVAGVLITATSSILIRLAQADGVPSLVIAGWRLTFAVLVLTPFALRRNGGEIRRLRRADVYWGIMAGVLLAVHLAAWIASLEYTSVASSAALVTTNPLWVALAVRFVFGERLSRHTVLGLLVAFGGSLLITFSDGGVLTVQAGRLQFAPQNLLAPAGKADTALFGDLLALSGAITVAGYLLVGRNLRRRLSNTAYVWLVYSAAMVAIVGAVLLSGDSMWGYSAIAYFWIFLLALGPQLMGHTAFNWALAHLSATFVALTVLGEPVGAAILAYLILGETFAPVQLAGFVMLLMGITLGVLGEN